MQLRKLASVENNTKYLSSQEQKGENKKKKIHKEQKERLMEEVENYE